MNRTRFGRLLERRPARIWPLLLRALLLAWILAATSVLARWLWIGEIAAAPRGPGLIALVAGLAIIGIGAVVHRTPASGLIGFVAAAALSAIAWVAGSGVGTA